MKVGKEDGLNLVYDYEGKPILMQDEQMISFGKGYYELGYLQTGSYASALKGITYLTNKRIIFIGTSSWLGAMPEHAISMDHWTHQVAQRGKQIHEDKIKEYYKYVEIPRSEIKKIKKTLTGEIKVQFEDFYVKITSRNKEFKRTVFEEFS